MRQEHDTVIEVLMEQIIANGTEDMASMYAGLFDLAMRIEREQFLGAGHYERTSGRRGYANGYKAKKLDTPAGTLSLNVPKTVGHLEGCGEPFFPQSLAPVPGTGATLQSCGHACRRRNVRQRSLDPRRRGHHERVRH